MIVAAAQPYFAPYPGFFAKARLCDTLVLLDTVQFPQRTTWMTRNRFKNGQGTLWMTVPVLRKGKGFQSIREVEIFYGSSWGRKHLRSLRDGYGRAPFFEEHLPFLDTLFGSRPRFLVDFNLAILRYLAEALRIPSKILLLSELGIEAREPRLTVEICRALGADEFLAQKPAGKFLDVPALRREGTEVRLFSPRSPVYPQLHGAFIADLSAFDLLFTCGDRAAEVLRRSANRER